MNDLAAVWMRQRERDMTREQAAARRSLQHTTQEIRKMLKAQLASLAADLKEAIAQSNEQIYSRFPKRGEEALAEGLVGLQIADMDMRNCHTS